MQIRQADQHMQTSLRAIAKRAKEDPKHRFGNLYSLLNEANLRWCFPQLNNMIISSPMLVKTVPEPALSGYQKTADLRDIM